MSHSISPPQTLPPQHTHQWASLAKLWHLVGMESVIGARKAAEANHYAVQREQFNGADHLMNMSGRDCGPAWVQPEPEMIINDSPVTINYAPPSTPPPCPPPGIKSAWQRLIWPVLLTGGGLGIPAAAWYWWDSLPVPIMGHTERVLRGAADIEFVDSTVKHRGE